MTGLPERLRPALHRRDRFRRPQSGQVSTCTSAGNRDGSRLNRLYREDADEDTILATLAPLFADYAEGPRGGRRLRRLHHPPAGGVTVYLVGAGPGDPELLTVKAHRVLQGADVVLHDSLVDHRVLELVPAGALLIDVGKRCGARATAQSDINRLICYHARRWRNGGAAEGRRPDDFWPRRRGAGGA